MSDTLGKTASSTETSSQASKPTEEATQAITITREISAFLPDNKSWQIHEDETVYLEWTQNCGPGIWVGVRTPKGIATVYLVREDIKP